MDIKDWITTNLDKLLVGQSRKGVLTVAHIIEIGAYVAGGVLRSRFSSEKEVSSEDINGVFGVIVTFYKQNFGKDFTPEDFESMQKKTLALLQSETFDRELHAFMTDLTS